MPSVLFYSQPPPYLMDIVQVLSQLNFPSSLWGAIFLVSDMVNNIRSVCRFASLWRCKESEQTSRYSILFFSGIPAVEILLKFHEVHASEYKTSNLKRYRPPILGIRYGCLLCLTFFFMAVLNYIFSNKGPGLSHGLHNTFKSRRRFRGQLFYQTRWPF